MVHIPKLVSPARLQGSRIVFGFLVCCMAPAAWSAAQHDKSVSPMRSHVIQSQETRVIVADAGVRTDSPMRHHLKRTSFVDGNKRSVSLMRGEKKDAPRPV